MQTTARFPVRDYDLAATLNSGQAFRWRLIDGAWEGVIHNRWVRLRQWDTTEAQGLGSSCIEATACTPQADWTWLTGYLRLDEDHAEMLATFPDDAPMRTARAHCQGLRLLRQEPWECLASFILSSTKQIVQIRQCVELLCQRYGDAIEPVGRAASSRVIGVPCPSLIADSTSNAGNGAHGVTRPTAPCFTFPTAARLAATTETELRGCKMGFRAKYLLAAARMVANGELDLPRLSALPLADARSELMRCPGVGMKIADCVLLFSCGHDEAFPIDVWVERALQQLYFPKRRARRARLEQFAATHFGPHAGLAQQYLFHYLRTGGNARSPHHAR
jgi:N-glycosylase/DNA lyase